MEKRLIGGAVILIVAVALFTLVIPHISANMREREARDVVTAFGTELKNASLLAPNASSTIADVYGRYVTEELLAVWQENPERAPGRLTSSPWPDRIEITVAIPQGDGYLVSGNVIYMSSENSTTTGNSGSVPVAIRIVPEGGEWRISEYTERAAIDTNP